MGKVATFTRARHRDVRQKRDQRTQRSRVERGRRLGTCDGDRKLRRIVAARKLPNDTDQLLLLNQFAQACRLPAASTDLCLLMRSYTGGALERAAEKEDTNAYREEAGTPARGSKRPRAEENVGEGEKKKANPAALNALADALASTAGAPVAGDNAEDDAGSEADEDADPMTVLLAILQSEYGRRVTATLLACLGSTPGCEAKCLEVAEIILAQFEENTYLAQHHIACRELSALVQYGPEKVRQGVLNLLRQRGTDLASVKALISNRHTSVTIENLLKVEPAQTSAWLRETLGLASPKVKPGKGKKAAKGAKTGSSEAEPEETLSEEGLMKLIEHPVAGQLIRQLINDTTRPVLLDRLNVATLLASKRGMSFLGAILTVPAATKGSSASSGDAGAAFASTLDELLEQTGADLSELAMNRQANFVVQKIILLAPHTPAKRQGEYFRRICHLLGDKAGLQAMAVHPIAVHVLCTLVVAALQSEVADSAAEAVGSLIITKSNVTELAGSQHGSLVVRSLMPLVKKSGTSKVGHQLLSSIEQNVPSLMLDAVGNLVVQEYLKAIGPAAASAFARKIKKEELLAFSRSQFASHVVFTLLDSVDATTRVALCNLLRPFVATLAVHLNGRFIVEKLIPASRDVRDELVRHFSELAVEKGTQHVLCTLVGNLDPHGKKSLMDNVIVPRIRDLATNPCGSVALQKLMQSDADVLAAVKRRLQNDSALSNALAQTFSGKFVVQIAMHGGGAAAHHTR